MFILVNMRKLILASQSPRRQELLGQMGVEFEVIPSNYEEKLDDSRDVEQVAIELGLGKTRYVAARYPDALVIGSDTIVSIDGAQSEKPVDTDDAKRTLRRLSGKKNVVTSSIAIVGINQGIELTGTDSTDVHFKELSDEIIDAYVATGDPMDKAASYGIQSGGDVLIDHIVGEYDTVIGLPSKLLSSLLSEYGIKSRPVHLVAPVPQMKG